MTILRISRDSGFADRTRDYTVIANGSTLGKIGNGETKDFEIDANEQEVYLSVDWCRSNKLSVVPSEDGVIHLTAESSLRGFKLFLALAYIALMPTKYIRLFQAHG
ncbi:hypothetical protein BM526_10215 [Alteromonas mediterranea]|uniref:hypothetical protein n=1 Tax=Alteromonas mediterranea TaxID=314275 RepID=UPI0009037A40|nr:hypothetical protein [Alteromonas mediterranea]APE02186.1 hypothetical protein BM526_10215 [Alteromonas mediterranea]